MNEYLGYLADRNYSPRTVRAYAFDLLHFARWLSGEGIGLDAVSTEVMPGFVGSCREAAAARRPGGNVYSILDGRNAGYAPAAVNRRLAVVSGLFAFRQMRDPGAVMPVPRGREARRAGSGGRTGLLGHLARPRTRSGAAGARASAAAAGPGRRRRGGPGREHADVAGSRNRRASGIAESPG